MNDELALLEAIRQTPDDDVPRLIYADWLEDRGDPRSQFIRMQCELAATTCAITAGKLEIKEKEWRHQHESLLLASLHNIKFYNVEFQRGFLHAMTLEAARFVDEATTLFQGAPLLSKVTLRGAERVMRRLTRLNHLAQIRSLDLTMNELDDRCLIRLAECPHLHNLSALILDNNQIRWEGIWELSQSCYLSNLRILHLCNRYTNNCLSRIGSRGAASLANSSTLIHLEDLRLAYNDIGDEGVVALCEAPNLGGLRTLDLSSNPMGGEGLGALTRGIYFQRLNKLILANIPTNGRQRQSLHDRYGDAVDFGSPQFACN